jgi:hypothetical protein
MMAMMAQLQQLSVTNDTAKVTSFPSPLAGEGQGEGVSESTEVAAP